MQMARDATRQWWKEEHTIFPSTSNAPFPSAWCFSLAAKTYQNNVNFIILFYFILGCKKVVIPSAQMLWLLLMA
jgi:hypothetical protein